VGYPISAQGGPASATIVWDGKDAFGRTMVGTQAAHARLCYQYQRPYALGEANAGASSGSAWGSPAPGSSVEFHTTRDFATTCSAWVDRTLGVDDTSLGLGGWTLSGVQPYDVGLGAHAGGGQALTGGTTTATLHLVAGTSQSGQTSSPDGTPLASASFAAIPAMTTGPDGSIYFAENSIATGQDFSLIRTITPDGQLKTIAGKKEGFSGDGGSAKDAQFGGAIGGLALGADGSVYVSDTVNNRIRRIAADGTVTTVAGGGPSNRNGSVGDAASNDGIPATQADIPSPQGIAVASDGTLYIAAATLVYQVDTNGIIHRYAGTGNRTASGDGGPARDASIFQSHFLEGCETRSTIRCRCGGCLGCDAEVVEQGLHFAAEGFVVAVDGGPVLRRAALSWGSDAGDQGADDLVAEGE
jgi:hypothetical protein